MIKRIPLSLNFIIAENQCDKVVGNEFQHTANQ